MVGYVRAFWIQQVMPQRKAKDSAMEVYITTMIACSGGNCSQCRHQLLPAAPTCPPALALPLPASLAHAVGHALLGGYRRRGYAAATILIVVVNSTQLFRVREDHHKYHPCASERPPHCEGARATGRTVRLAER